MIPCPVEGCMATVVHLIKHLDTEHVTGADGSVTCTHCQETYASMLAMQDHVRRRIEDFPVSCTVCGKKVRRMDDHMRDAHPADPPVPCTRAGCGKYFTTLKLLRKHIRSIHETDGREPCTKCGRRVRDLPEHVRRQHPPCGYRLCMDCSPPIEVRNIRVLRRHQVAVHGAGPAPVASRKRDRKRKEAPDPATIKCTICGLQCKSQHGYDQHLNSITNKCAIKRRRIMACDEIFTCPVCSLPFPAANSLDAHIREVHPASGEEESKEPIAVLEVEW